MPAWRPCSWRWWRFQCTRWGSWGSGCRCCSGWWCCWQLKPWRGSRLQNWKVSERYLPIYHCGITQLSSFGPSKGVYEFSVNLVNQNLTLLGPVLQGLRHAYLDFNTLKLLTSTYPEAQFPLAVPPFAEHSLVVKQVPFRLFLKAGWTRWNSCHMDWIR